MTASPSPLPSLPRPFPASGDAPSRALVRRAPTTRLGGMRIAVLGMRGTVELMVEAARSHPRPGLPLYFTSANGEVLSRHARCPDFARDLATADLVSADGQPMVALSHAVAGQPLPERVATTDLFHGVAEAAALHGLTFYMLGATEEENLRAVENVQRRHPALRIVGRSHGYLQGEALARKIDEINALKPDILWLALGVPREQDFVAAHGPRLTQVGLIKTSGGLFNFLSGSRARAPDWMQALCLEWLWRIKEEPSRLLWRYATTNPHAIWLLVTRSGSASEIAASLGHRLRARMQKLMRRARGLAPRAACRTPAPAHAEFRERDTGRP